MAIYSNFGRRRTFFAVSSLLISLVVLAIKYSAYLVSGSGALLSDAIETILNVIAALGTLGAVAVAARPADDNHPYGHEKAEYLWAVIEGVLVFLTAIGILLIAFHDFMYPTPLHAPLKGVALNALAGGINFIWARLLIQSGHRQQSEALLAAGLHLQSDVWASLGLVVGVSLIPLLHWLWIDPLLSTLIACNVLWTGFSMIRRSMSGLMDEAPPAALIEQVRCSITHHGAGAIEAHDLRMRKVSDLYFIEFHLVVPNHMQITEAHEICDRIEAAIRAFIHREYIGRCSIHIHIEPEDKAKQHLSDHQEKSVLVLSR